MGPWRMRRRRRRGYDRLWLHHCWIVSNEEQDAVDVIRHYDKFIQFHKRVVGWNTLPAINCHQASAGGAQFAVRYVAEHALALASADGHEICMVLPVIKTMKTYVLAKVSPMV